MEVKLDADCYHYFTSNYYHMYSKPLRIFAEEIRAMSILVIIFFIPLAVLLGLTVALLIVFSFILLAQIIIDWLSR